MEFLKMLKKPWNLIVYLKKFVLKFSHFIEFHQYGQKYPVAKQNGLGLE